MNRIWKIAPGNRASDWRVFLENECIGIGWLENHDFLEFDSAADILEALQEINGPGKSGYGAGAADMIWEFTHGIKTNDVIVANDGYNRIVGIGLVKSGYLRPDSRINPLRNDATTHRHHARRMKWVISKPASISSTSHEKYFFVQRTIKELTPEQIEHIVVAYQKAYPNDTTLERQNQELFGNGPGWQTPTASDLSDPETRRVKTTNYRILRDTKLARTIKKMHSHECQICGETIELPDRTRYAEAHHIKPLGREHNGKDVIGNILCLCPNHHAECDLGTIRLSKKALRSVDGHEVSATFLTYHNKCIYRTSYPTLAK